ncbi:hypothetical protein AVI51_05960 [Piscirickettsia salmonis]|uniref:Uncharacterized protein n=1 Tax=Piscirickettsia salmonis TaxID=1238 RepID=A0A9Q6PXH5_PISSA|nr:hypothetical protein [Piscirickettsia salmonis]ALA25635.1 methyltransferase domain protein [Piscirickettsia salmonis]APS43135.1 hypothetical protein AVI48_01185 [Piscirickettsia salmonis]APS46482.1 hypothetical protein AVI49_01780 [Piscirickettsia salmonis]APS50450.1 hypothetical protein AVI50_06025 [Piscirickettsia salmonis]APS53653.1 hypothetical protein AVI51_05960 [Piscirickettsia salmonis]
MDISNAPIEIDDLNQNQMIRAKGNKGYIINRIDPFAQRFINYCRLKSMRVMEVAAGYGYISEKVYPFSKKLILNMLTNIGSLYGKN